MKKIFILILITIPFFSMGQSFWSVVADDLDFNKSHVTDKALFQDSILLVSGFVSDMSCPHQKLFAYNLKGDTLWTKDGYYDYIDTDSNFIYTVGQQPMDDVGPREAFVLSKFDRLGNEVSNTRYNSNNNFRLKPSNLEVSIDGTILICADRAIIKTNTKGVTPKEYLLPDLLDIESAFSLNPLTNLITTKRNLYQADSAFIIKKTISFSNDIIKTLVHEDTIYALFDFSLLRLDSSFNIIDTLISNSADSLRSIEFYGKNIWVHSKNKGILTLKRINNQKIDRSFTFDLLSNVEEFVVSKDNYAFIGNSYSKQIAIYNYNFRDLPAARPTLSDIEIVNFNIDSITYFNTPNYGIVFNFVPEITVKNNGSDVIKSLAVSLKLQGGMFCVRNFLYQKFTRLDLQPGQSKTIRLKKAQQLYMDSSFCFEVLAPNSQIEIATNNNFLCKTITLDKIDPNNGSSIMIYPNPTVDNIYIDNLSPGSRTVEVIDNNGKVVFSQNTVTQNLKIDVSFLPAGLFTVKIISREGILTRLIGKY